MERTAETTGGDAAYPEVKLVEAAAAGLLACGPEHVLEFKETLSRLSASVSSLGTGVSSLGTGGSRRAYILHAFPLWSAVLLARVAPQLNIFDRREKEALFDAFFKNIPAPFSVQALCSWLVQTPLPALEQHIPSITKASSVLPGENAGDAEAARLLAELLSAEGLRAYFSAFVGADTPPPKNTVDVLLRCPGAVNNRLLLRAPPMFQRKAFDAHLATGLVQAIARTTPLPAEFARLHTDLVAAFRGQHRRLKSVADAWVQQLSQWPGSKTCRPPPLVISSALIPDSALASFLEVFVQSLDKGGSSPAFWPWFNEVLGPALRTKAVARHALSERILLKCALTPRTIEAIVNLIALVDVAGATLLSAALERIGDQWSQASFCQRTDHALQESITHVLISGLAFVSRDELERGSGRLLLALVQGSRSSCACPNPCSVFLFLFKVTLASTFNFNCSTSRNITLLLAMLASNLGVSHRLHSSVPPIRRNGMRVATTFAKKLGQPLDFDELLEDSTEKPGPTQEPSLRPRMTSDVASRERKGKAVPNPDAAYCESDSSSDESEQEEECGTPAGGAFQTMAPFDLRDDTSDLRKVQRPVYLRTCLDFISSGDGADNVAEKHELALKSVEDLARRGPPDLDDLCEPLAHALLCLENLFNLKDFEKHKSAALVALCVASPNRVSRVLIATFFDAGMSTGTKLETLDVLVSSASALSGLLVTSGLPSDGRAAALLSEDHGGVRGTQGKSTIVPARHVHFRRWGYRRSSAPRTFRNGFAQIAGETFFPLSRGLAPGGSLSVFSHPDSTLLVPQLLLTLSALTECARNTPHAGPLALELLMCSWSLRDSSEAGVRRAALLALNVALEHVKLDSIPGDVFSTIQEIGEYVQNVFEMDPDGGCRGAALALARRSSALGALGE